MGKAVQKSVFIFKPDDTSFQVEMKSPPKLPAKSTLYRYEEDDIILYEMRVLLEPKVVAKDFNTEIKLTTNDSMTPEITIPLTAVIAN